jgi:hypothetical protein
MAVLLDEGTVSVVALDKLLPALAGPCIFHERLRSSFTSIAAVRGAIHQGALKRPGVP